MVSPLRYKFNKIADVRIKGLFDLARSVSSKDLLLASRYVRIARDISKKYQVSLDRGDRFVFCKRCGSFLRFGVNGRVRLTRGKVVVSCSCGGIRRIPFC